MIMKKNIDNKNQEDNCSCFIGIEDSKIDEELFVENILQCPIHAVQYCPFCGNSFLSPLATYYDYYIVVWTCCKCSLTFSFDFWGLKENQEFKEEDRELIDLVGQWDE